MTSDQGSGFVFVCLVCCLVPTGLIFQVSGSKPILRILGFFLFWVCFFGSAWFGFSVFRFRTKPLDSRFGNFRSFRRDGLPTDSERGGPRGPVKTLRVFWQGELSLLQWFCNLCIGFVTLHCFCFHFCIGFVTFALGHFCIGFDTFALAEVIFAVILQCSEAWGLGLGL